MLTRSQALILRNKLGIERRNATELVGRIAREMKPLRNQDSAVDEAFSQTLDSSIDLANKLDEFIALLDEAVR